MEPQEIQTLAMAGATTIVAAMATDAWATARDRAVELFHRRSPDRQADIEAQLDANAALVTRAGDGERARGTLIQLWQLELEGFLADYPDAAGDLSALAAEIRTALPAAQQQWVQNNTARDDSVVNAVQHGSQHNYYMDATSARPPEGLEPDESQG
ncbi:hypothetical protein BSZ07_38090 [Streptomyces sp. M1013]|uniref:hypothetical protein n=1 Tax=Streptomyces sp. M1013 TaxID=549798 RepID=UPI0009790193|nr:hypothetical protein [Streptomyces sp. M1013]OMI84591.1 hypothetical protein BSZ07_38090 [Streptomyces sp. M1013]